MVPVVGAARVEVGGERHVDGDHGCECPGEDRHAHLAPECGAAKAMGGGRGGELEGGGLDERGEEALGARAEATGAVQLGQNDADLHRHRHLWISEAAAVRVFQFRTTTHKRPTEPICAFGIFKFQIEGTVVNKAQQNLFASIRPTEKWKTQFHIASEISARAPKFRTQQN